MKALLLVVALLAGVLGARGGVARVLVREGAFREGPVDVRWKAEYPVAISGWSGAELAALWARIDAYCFLPALCSEEAVKAALPARPEGVLRRVAEKLAAASETDAVSGRALDVIAEVRVPFASKDWVGLVYDGYDNEGGNGCHAVGALEVLSRKDLAPMPWTWFIKDVPGARREILRRLAEARRDDFPEDKRLADEAFWKACEDNPEGFLPTLEGVRFRYPAYSILPGCYGLPEVTVPWVALVPFCDADRLTELRSLLPKPHKPTQENER